MSLSFTSARRLKDAEYLLEMAWGVIANASRGDWMLESRQWQAAAAAWRDKWFAFIGKGVMTPGHEVRGVRPADGLPAHLPATGPPSVGGAAAPSTCIPRPDLRDHVAASAVEIQPLEGGKEDAMAEGIYHEPAVTRGAIVPGRMVQGQAPQMEGTVRERIASLQREVAGLEKVAAALQAALEPVTRAEVPSPTGAPSAIFGSPQDRVQRAPQCGVADQVNALERDVRVVVSVLNGLIDRLEV